MSITYIVQILPSALRNNSWAFFMVRGWDTVTRTANMTKVIAVIFFLKLLIAPV